MAVKHLAANRRGFLVGAAASAAAIGTPILSKAAAIDGGRAWDAAMARATRARAASDAFDNGPQFGLSHSEAVKRADELSDALAAAQRELMDMPAPHRAALRWKLDEVLIVEGDGYTSAWSEDYVRQLLVDYQRLLGDA